MATHIYTVHAPPEVSGQEAAERAVILKDGISWPALFFGILWLLWHRLWLALLVYLGFVALVVASGAWIGQGAANLVALIGQILFALEANNIRRWTLARHGWREIGDSFGRNRAEAEIRFFHSEALRPARAPAPDGPPQWVSGLATGRVSAPGRSAVPAVSQPDEQGLGLFPEQDR